MVARWAHNPKVGGSNPSSATKIKPCRETAGLYYFQTVKSLLLKGMEIKNPWPREARQGFFYVKHLP